MAAIKHYIFNVKKFSKKEDWNVGYNLWGALTQDQRDLLIDIRGKARGPKEKPNNHDKKDNGKLPPKISPHLKITDSIIKAPIDQTKG